MPTQVLVTYPFADELVQMLRAVSPDLVVTQSRPEDADYSQAEVLYSQHIPPTTLVAPNLRWVALHPAGVDGLRAHPLAAAGVTFTNSSGLHAPGVAEFVLTMLLSLAHRVPTMVDWQRAANWPSSPVRRREMTPLPIRGATVGILGYGSIGREVARLVTDLGARVVVTKQDPSERRDHGYCRPGTGDPEGLLPERWLTPAQLPLLLAQADYVVNCLPLTPATAGVLNEAAFRTMKPTAYLINVGRGATTDEDAMHRALTEQWIAGASIDVFREEPQPPDNRFYGLPNVFATPHLAGYMANEDSEAAELFAENLRRYLAGHALLDVVDAERGY